MARRRDLRCVFCASSRAPHWRCSQPPRPCRPARPKTSPGSTTTGWRTSAPGTSTASSPYFDDESEFLHRNPRIQARGAGAARAEFKKLFAQYNVTLRLKQRRVSALPILIQEDGEYEETLVPVHGGETLHVSGRYITTYLRTATVRRFRVQKIWLH